MTRSEVIMVTRIMLTADNWCGTCSSALLDQLKALEPTHSALVEQVSNSAGDLENRLSQAKTAWEAGGCIGDEPSVLTV